MEQETKKITIYVVDFDELTILTKECEIITNYEQFKNNMNLLYPDAWFEDNKEAKYALIDYKFCFCDGDEDGMHFLGMDD